MSYLIKYKPKLFSDIVISSLEVKTKLDTYIYAGNKQPILLYGGYGVGKSLISELLPSAIVGGDAYIEKIPATDFRTTADVKAAFPRNRFYNNLADRVFLVSHEINFTSTASEAFRDIVDYLQEDVQFILSTNEFRRMDGGIVDRCNAIEIVASKANDWLPRVKMILQKESVCGIPDAVLLDFLNAQLAHQKSHRKLLEALEIFVFQCKRDSSNNSTLRKVGQRK
jgi:replication-associated recombination protein RarA